MNLVPFIIFVIFHISCECTANTQVPVISFQSDGKFSSETYFKRSGKLGEGNGVLLYFGNGMECIVYSVEVMISFEYYV